VLVDELETLPGGRFRLVAEGPAEPLRFEVRDAQGLPLALVEHPPLHTALARATAGHAAATTSLPRDIGLAGTDGVTHVLAAAGSRLPVRIAWAVAPHSAPRTLTLLDGFQPFAGLQLPPSTLDSELVLTCDARRVMMAKQQTRDGVLELELVGPEASGHDEAPVEAEPPSADASPLPRGRRQRVRLALAEAAAFGDLPQVEYRNAELLSLEITAARSPEQNEAPDPIPPTTISSAAFGMRDRHG